MSLNIVANSTNLLISGLITAIGAVLVAVWIQAFWPLLFVLVGCAMAFRLQRDMTSVAKAALIKRGALIHQVDKNFYGWLNDYLVHAPYDRKHLVAVEELLATSLKGPTEPTEMLASSSDSKLGLIRLYPLRSIRSISFTTDEKSFTIHTDDKDSEHSFKDPNIRDGVLKFIKPHAQWQVTEEVRTKFKLNFLAILGSLLLMFFAIALAFTAIGIVQPNQLPLATWADLKNFRGKAGGWMFVWVCLCEAYMWLAKLNLPAALKFVLSVTASFGLAALMYYWQWTKVADTTWHNP